MKDTVKYCCLILLFASCSVSKGNFRNIEGIYRQTGNPNTQLIFKKSTFTFIDPYNNDLALYTCCDTITAGVWIREDDLLCLSTPQLASSVVNSFVKELTTGENDTIYFHIGGPIEQYYKKYEVKDRDIFYRVSLTEDNGNLLSSWLQEYKSNVIKIPKPRGVTINRFSISAYPSAKFGGRNIGTKEVSTSQYQIKNESSNLFQVYIPQLSYEFMSYIRLNRDFVRILSTNKLEWDGHIYTKE